MKSRSFGMDVIRTVSIWMVLVAHIAYWFMPSPDGVYITWVTPLMLGVEPFFVLGGFLAALSFFKIQKVEDQTFAWVDVKQYWYRRWMRTLPNYFLFVLVYFAAFSVFKDGFSFDFRYLFFLQNLFWLAPNFFSPSWSLATQEWFYFLFPLMFFAISPAMRARSIMVTCLLFIAFSLIVRLYFAGVYEFSNLEGFLRRVAALRMDSVVVGVMTGWLYLNRKCFHRNQRMWFLIGLIGVIAMAYLRRQEEFNSIGAVQIVFYPLFSFFISLTMPFLYELPASSSEGFNRFFEATSKWSYSIYLSHVFFKDGMYLVAGKLGLTNNLSIMLAMALVWLVIVYVVSALIYNKFELPFMRLLYQRQKNKKLMQAIK